MIFWDRVGLSFLTFVLQARKIPEKTSSRESVPTGDGTRARCVTGAHVPQRWTQPLMYGTLMISDGDFMPRIWKMNPSPWRGR